MNVSCYARRPRSFITGGTGFVGQAMARCLVAAGHEVMVVTRQRTSEHQVQEGCDVRRTDWTIASLTGLLREWKPTFVFHLAGKTDVAQSLKHPADYIESNVLLTSHLLEAVRLSTLQPMPAVILAGSMHEYTLSGVATGVTEEWPRLPTSPYGYSKRLQAEVATMYRKLYGVPVVTARLFNLMGPGAKAGVVAQLVGTAVRIERGEQEPVMKIGSTSMTRDFLDVRDAALALLSIANATPGIDEAVNVCSGVDTSFGQVADELMRALHGRGFQVEVDPSLTVQGEPECVRGDNAKLCDSTGWKPRFSLAESLADALFVARRKANVEKGDGGHEGDDDSGDSPRDYSAVHHH